MDDCRYPCALQNFGRSGCAASFFILGGSSSMKPASICWIGRWKYWKSWTLSKNSCQVGYSKSLRGINMQCQFYKPTFLCGQKITREYLPRHFWPPQYKWWRAVTLCWPCVGRWGYTAIILQHWNSWKNRVVTMPHPVRYHIGYQYFSIWYPQDPLTLTTPEWYLSG